MLTRKQTQLLDALVRQAPKLDAIFSQVNKPEGKKGACVTYSRVVAEVLGENQIRAVVRPVLIQTADRVALDYLHGKISLEEAKKRGGRIQVWGDIREGQSYQHAVCYIADWDVIIDLGMARRKSGLVPSHPYWAEGKKFPWWLHSFQFMTYPLESRGYDTYPGQVKEAKELIREVVTHGLRG